MSMNQEEILKLLARLNAIIVDSHVVYASGKHGSAYVNKDAIFPHTRDTANLCRQIAESFGNHHVEVVIAPVIGGVIISQWVAHHLSFMTGRPVLCTYAEKETESFKRLDGRQCYFETGNFVIKRGYDQLISGRNVLVVEDILNSGGTVERVVNAVRQYGGNVVGVGAFCNRGGVTPAHLGGVPSLYSLVNVTMDAWEAADCPLCAAGVPINTTVGKGKAFLDRQAANK